MGLTMLDIALVIIGCLEVLVVGLDIEVMPVVMHMVVAMVLLVAVA